MQTHVWLALLATLTLCSACGSKKDQPETKTPLGSKFAAEIAEKAIEKQTGKDATVAMDGNNLTVQTDQGTVKVTSGDDAELPADFPKDVPLYTGAKLTHAITTPGGVNATLSSKDAPDAVTAFYLDKLAGAGWTKSFEMKDAANQMLTFTKGTQNLTVLATGQDAGSLISLTVATK